MLIENNIEYSCPYIDITQYWLEEAKKYIKNDPKNCKKYINKSIEKLEKIRNINRSLKLHVEIFEINNHELRKELKKYEKSSNT